MTENMTSSTVETPSTVEISKDGFTAPTVPEEPKQTETDKTESAADSASEKKNPRRKWWWVLIALGAGLLLGLLIAGLSAASYKNRKTREVYNIARENGYSGLSGLKKLEMFLKDPAIAKVAEAMDGSVVTITVEFEQDGETAQALGSGVIFKQADGGFYIVSNAHVVGGRTAIEVWFSDEESVQAKLIGSDTRSDIGVIFIQEADLSQETAAKLKAAEFADSDKVRLGDTAIVIGTPQALEYAYSVSCGIISGLDRQVEVGGIVRSYMQTDAAINPGNSGGAMVNAEGKLIGIASAKMVSETVEGICFAIPINTAAEIIDQLMSQGRVQWLSLGVSDYKFMTEPLATAYELPVGLIVYGLRPNGAAEKAGVQVGDIIVSIDGMEISSAERLEEILSGYKVGDTVWIAIFRDRPDILVRSKLTLEEQVEEEDFWGK